jgi:hypothetical protein
MFYAGNNGFANDEDPYAPGHITFDKHGSFELRYARHRRYSETEKSGKLTRREPQPYLGEFEQQLHRNP